MRYKGYEVGDDEATEGRKDAVDSLESVLLEDRLAAALVIKQGDFMRTPNYVNYAALEKAMFDYQQDWYDRQEAAARERARVQNEREAATAGLEEARLPWLG